MTDERPVIDVRDLTKTYDGALRAIDRVTFQVPAGSICGVLGPNGAGKSTTIKILTTLARPDSGTARVAGVDVVAAPDRARPRFGWVAQRSGADLRSTGRENLVLQGRLHGMRGRALQGRVDELIDRFDLGRWAGRLARTYSDGIRRRLDVAVGLVHRPQVLFLDEPTAGLDPEAQDELWSELRGLREQGITVVFTTHVLDEADQMAQTLVLLDRGRVVVQGTPAELKRQLRGDALHIRPADPCAERTVKGILETMCGVRDIAVSGGVFSVRVDHGPAYAPAVLAALEMTGVSVASMSMSSPTLGDVYRSHVGRTFHSLREVCGR